jgi:hypothetical protein
VIDEAIRRFPATFGLRGFPGEVFRISRTHSYIGDSGAPVLYTERKSGDDWPPFAKGSESEIRAEMVSP